VRRRLLIATASGLVFGLLHCLLAFKVHGLLPWPAIATFVLARGVLGFVIGISKLKMRWWSHGLLLGFVVTLPAALSIRLMPSITFGMSADAMTMLALLFGLVIGFLIEWVTSVLFQAKSEAAL
jgi:hypothetical protein